MEVIAEKRSQSLLEGRSSNFPNLVRQLQNKSAKIANVIDGCMNEDSVCELFANKYEVLYNSDSFKENDISKVKSVIDSSIATNCQSGKCYSSHTINVSDICDAIKCLKKGKDDGFANTYLSLVMNALYIHGFVPEEICIGTIVPIPKNKRKSMSDSNNYRSITLSSIFGKMFDIIFLKSNMCIFKSSDLQFGFKEQHSTLQCNFVCSELIQYYINRKSTVHALMIDASQAFDRVQYVKLFQLLLKRGLCPLAAQFLINLYTQQKLRVRWGSSVSRTFIAKNGVKQGGVLSPRLFAIYMDALVFQLQEAGYRCHIGDKYIGALVYADDVILLGPTIMSLRLMLNTVNNFGKEFDVKFNPNKSQYIVFGNSKSIPMSIKFNEIHLSPVESANYLGVIIGKNCSEAHIKVAKIELIRRFNVLNNIFKFCSVKVKYSLFKSFCTALYGCVLWDFTSNQM